MRNRVLGAIAVLPSVLLLGSASCAAPNQEPTEEHADTSVVEQHASLRRNRESSRAVDWKLLFNQLFALEIRKEYGRDALESMLAEHSYYSPKTFNEAIAYCTNAGTSLGAYSARQRVFEDPENRRLIANLDFTRSVGAAVRQRPDVRRFLSAIENQAGRSIRSDENFFASPEAQNAIAAYAAQGEEVAFVLMPGYAAHAIKSYIFEELVKDANQYYGRPAERPVLAEDGIDLEFQDHATFYGTHNDRVNQFDVLHPTGLEMGNTTGADEESTDLLYQWIQTLPPEYARKKLIILGYSKGAPIVLNLVNRHPELSERILAFVTYAGVVQGTNVARMGLEETSDLLRDRTMSELVDRLEAEDPEALARVLSPLFSHIDTSIATWPKLRELFGIFGYDVTPFQRLVRRLLSGREAREIVDGIIALSPEERVRWNLLHLDNATFRHPVTMFNLSAVMNIESLMAPNALLAPTMGPDGDLDWSRFSLDAAFLYTTSIGGFRTAPGGLFDTQVELGNTKMPMLDTRPLSESLTADELDALWRDAEVQARLRSHGVTTREAFAQRPRRDLIPAEKRDNIESIDLGEIRGHHWSLFVQALRPPADIATDHPVWDFPRKAYMRALVQTMALHQLITRDESGARQ